MTNNFEITCEKRYDAKSEGWVGIYTTTNKHDVCDSTGIPIFFPTSKDALKAACAKLNEQINN